MKRIVFLLLSAASVFGTDWIVEQQPASLPPLFRVYNKREAMGWGTRRLTSIAPAFDLIDETGEVAVYSTARLLSWALIVDVTDREGNKIGRIEEEVWKIYGWPEYKFFDETGAFVAIGQMDPLKIECTVFDPKNRNHVYAKIKRPLVSVTGDQWSVTVEEERVDMRLLLLLPLYQTNRDLKFF